MPAPIYWVEILQNLQKVRATVIFHGRIQEIGVPFVYIDKRAIKLQDVQVECPLLHIEGITFQDHQKSFVFVLPLPSNVCEDEGMTYKVVANKYMEIEVLFRSDMGSKSFFKKTYPSGPTKDQITHICCRECESTLLMPTSSIDKILPLPSEHWIELSEMWICHNDECHQNFPKEELTAQKGRCLLGASLIGINVDDLDHSSVILSSENQNGVVLCASCNAELGSNASNKNTVNFWLYALSSKDGENDPFQHHSVSTFCARSLLITAQSKATYRLAIYCNRWIQDTDNASKIYDPLIPVLVIQIIGWQNYVATNFEYEENGLHFESMDINLLEAGESKEIQGKNGYSHALKVAFLIVQDKITATDPSLIERMTRFMAAPHEGLTFSEMQCLSLSKMLNASKFVFPEDQRTFDGLCLGFLPSLNTGML